MYFAENVQHACDYLDIANPLREEDVTVAAVSFLVDGVWLRIEGTDMNRAGRLFFQRWDGEETRASASIFSQGNEMFLLKELAQIYFAERWNDAEKAARAMILAIKEAQAITVHWK